MSRFPVAFRPTGIRFLAILFPLGNGPPSRSAYQIALETPAKECRNISYQP